MGSSFPRLDVSFNGHVPIDGDPDMLWHVLAWALMLVADGGTEVQYSARLRDTANGDQDL